MAVDPERHRWVSVTEAPSNGTHVHPTGDQFGRAEVAQLVEVGGNARPLCQPAVAMAEPVREATLGAAESKLPGQDI